MKKWAERQLLQNVQAKDVRPSAENFFRKTFSIHHSLIFAGLSLRHENQQIHPTKPVFNHAGIGVFDDMVASHFARGDRDLL
jgi:hypothetical protein